MDFKKEVVPKIVPVFNLKSMYTDPKIFIPKVKNETGKMVPTIAPGKYWYVKYSYRDPASGKLKEFREKKGINTIKSITLRTRAVKNLHKAVLKYLQLGYSPFEDVNNALQSSADKSFCSAKVAIEMAIEQKSKIWSKNTKNICVIMINVFIRFLKKNELYDADIKKITKKHVIIFLNDLGKDKNKKIGATTRNTYRKNLSSIFKQMANDEIIIDNFIEKIPVLKQKPTKNKPFTKSQIIQIKEYLLEHDPYLYLFIKFVMYGFFRPVEVVRIKLKDINLDRNTISVKSKTEDSTANVVYMTKQLRETFSQMKLKSVNLDYNLFTLNFTPGTWSSSDAVKRIWFGKRFLKVKIALNLNENYGIYSFRHTAAIDLFTTYQKQGLTDLEAKHKMLPITRHKSIDSLNMYLRDIGASLPKDYSDDYSLDF
jgi:integrase